jgi:hypothetical protein
VNPFTFITDLVERLRFGDMCRPSPVLPQEPIEVAPPYETPISRPRAITRVGAWAGAATIRNPLPNIRAAKAMKLDDLHVMVADHSAWRTEHAFSDRPAKGRRAAAIDDLVAVGRVCAQHDIGLGLTTWIMPHTRYVASCAHYLTAAVEALAGVCPVTSIILDAEEPWTKATGGVSWNRAGDQLGQLLAPLQARPHEIRIGLTGIGYAREAALDPLAEWCDFGNPQVYATKDNGLDPRKSPKFFADRWTKAFETKKLVIGLPAYNQAPGMMTAAIEGVREVARDTMTAEVDEVVYWSLAQLRASAARARFVAGIKEAR